MRNCIHCGKEMDEGMQFCPTCGKPVVAEEQKKMVQGKEGRKKPVKKMVVIAAALVLFLAIFFGVKNGGQLNENDMLAYENCLTLKENLKNPDSFKLYSDIVMLRWSDNLMGNECNYMYINYGGTNSYGAVVRNTAIFDGTSYIMNSGDEQTSLREGMAELVFLAHSSGWEWKKEKDMKEHLGLEYEYEYIGIHTDKVKKKLGLE